MFANKQIVCVEYQDITESDEREIFQRVQLGMALTPAEKMQVINGPHAAFVRYIQAKYFKGDGLLASDALEWDKTRGADFRCIAQAFYQMANPTLRNSSIPQLEKFLSQSNPPSEDLKRGVEQAFQVLATLVQDKKLGKTIKKAAPKFSPVEFIMTCVAIYHWKDRLSLTACANGVARLRDNARNLHVDIRTNNRVVKTMLDFISSYKPPAAEAGGEAAVHCIDPRILSGAGIESDVEEPGDKRKRSSMDIDSDEESEEEKPLKKKVASQTKRSRKISPAAMVPPPSASPVSVQSPSAMEGITPTSATTSSVPPPPKHDRMAAVREAKAASARSAPPPASATSAPPNPPSRRTSANYPQPHLTLSHLPSPPVHAGPGHPSNSSIIPVLGSSRPVPAPNLAQVRSIFTFGFFTHSCSPINERIAGQGVDSEVRCSDLVSRLGFVFSRTLFIYSSLLATLCRVADGSMMIRSIPYIVIIGVS